MAACSREREWYYFIAVALVTFFGGLFIILPCRVFWYICCKRKPATTQHEPPHHQHQHHNTEEESPHTRACFARSRARAIAILSGHTRLSTMLVVFLFLMNMTACCIYLAEATDYVIEPCGKVQDEVQPLLYVALCGLFIIHYIIRFVASPDKLFFWIDIYSIVDHFTIGPTIYGLIVDSNWLGLKCLRLLYLLQLPEILQQIHVLKSSKSIRLTQVATIFASIWLVSSGFVHLTENNGDPFHDYSNGAELGYWMCVYWLLVTMSTVGFGEISPSTDLSRAFIVIFIMGSFAMFSTLIPELARHLGKSHKYTKPYKRVYGKRHVVVCGHITYKSVTNFIMNFIHEDADNQDTNVVFIDNVKPDLELAAFFRRRFNDVTFLQGTVLDVTSLSAVKVQDADACIILANRTSEKPDEEDAANIMRATAVKNYSPTTRIIIQLLQSYNKKYLLHIPNWNWSSVQGDDVICISELKLGIIAQNCLAPGVATLLANLFTMRSCDTTQEFSWQELYRYGASNELYVERFSSAFVGCSYLEAVQLCFSKWNIVLIGVEDVSTSGRGHIRINPASNAKIASNTIGFFIAQSPDIVKNVTIYNPKGSVKREAFEVSLSKNGTTATTIRNPSLAAAFPDIDATDQASDVGTLLQFVPLAARGGAQRKRRPSYTETNEDSQPLYDFTGNFHWCEARELEASLLTYDGLCEKELSNHVVVILLANADSPIIGLCHFLMPLRTSNFYQTELKDVIILCNLEYIKQEWDTIANFPEVYIYQGDAGHRPDLRALRVDTASMCVILSARKQFMVDSHNMDVDAILTTLNVQSLQSTNVQQQIRSIGTLTNPDVFRSHMTSGDIPMTTELEIDSNVAYLDQDDEDDPNMPLYMTVPVASGRAVAASVLDSLVTATYLDSRLLTILRALITGGSTAEFEQILADGLGIVRKNTNEESPRDRARLMLFALDQPPLSNIEHDLATYGQLFELALRHYGIICLGVYRLLSPNSKDTNKRFIVTSPRADLPFQPNDQIFCLQPFPDSANNNNTLKGSFNAVMEDATEVESMHL